jgi:uncharacterized protein YjbI with pentapeptide repeats
VSYSFAVTGFGLLSLIILFNLTSDVAYAQQGTPFLQEEIDAIIEIIQDIQDQLDNITVTWSNIDNKPLGFADDIDNDTLMEISTSCTIDQIAKWNGTQWNCADSAENDEGGEVALRKLDCYILRDAYTKTKWVDFQDGCDLRDLAISIGTDFSNLNLKFANLNNVFFDETDLTNTNLSYADLTDAEFDVAILIDADFTGANLSKVEFNSVDFTGATFTGTNLSNADLSGENLSNADFTGANLSNANLSGANLTNADFTGATFTGAYADPACVGIEECDSFPTVP